MSVDIEEEAELRRDAALSINDNALKSIASVVAEYVALEIEREKIGVRLNEIDDRLSAINNKIMPELMEAAGASSLTDAATGRVIEMGMMVAGAIVKGDLEKREAQLRYVESLGGQALIKTKVTFEFDRGEKAKAQALMALAKDAGYEGSASEDIHASTLAAWGRERLRNGQDLEPEKAGLYAKNMAAIYEPKVIKKKIKRGKI